MLSVRRSLAFSFAQRYTNLLLSVPTIMIVSRLLTPAQVGVFSLGMAFVGLIHSLRDFGVSDYIVQAYELKDGLAQTAFAINVIISWSLGIVVYLSSSYIAEFYREPGLALLLQIFCINFFLMPFGTTVYSMMKRSMQFHLIYRINVLQQFTQSAFTVGLAYLGFGYLGLGLASVASMIVLVLASITIGHAYRIRGLSLSHWRDVANFGVQRTTTDIVKRVAASTPDFVIGRVLDFAAVGLFSRGKGLVNMFDQNIMAAIKTVTFPSYAKDFREAGDPGKRYLTSKEFTSAISWPFMGFAALLAFPIMRIMFGDQWDAAIPILQVFALASIIGSLNSDAPEFLVAAGRVSVVTKIMISVQLLRIGLTVAAAYYSLLAVAAVNILTVTIVFFGFHWPIIKYSSVTWSGLGRSLARSAITTIVALIGPLSIVALVPPSDDSLWLPLLLSLVLAAVGWIVGIVFSGHPMRGELVNAWTVAKNRVFRPSSSSESG
ncbi:oligosaccharide flippase family protein [Salinisphaera aquimarina]|uniref:Oligosaccharide flippase family protein n=1 Tax=Salinisphaera aquimarina TaxID=2094031 RepID=A0ABV7ETY8_9GAMM